MRRLACTGLVFLGFLASAQAQTNSTATPEENTLSASDIRELLDAAKETAKATRENVNYERTVPDILFQILAKLDKLESKLDRIETAIGANKGRPAKKH